MSSSRKLVCAMWVVCGLMFALSSMTVKAADKPPAAPAAKIDLNTATEEQLQELPGVGDATAKKIIAGRPYKTVDDLAKHGIRASTIDKIAAQVVQPRDAAAAATTKKEEPKTTATPAIPSKGDAPVNINTADEVALEELPGVGAATAKKIVAGRPYKTAADLLKAGVPQKTIDKITPHITMGGSPAASAPAGNAPAHNAPTTNAPTGKEAPKATGTKDDIEVQTPPQEGMVWVNTESHIFHSKGDHLYGKGKGDHWKWMTEDDAVKAGNRASKTK